MWFSCKSRPQRCIFQHKDIFPDHRDGFSNYALLAFHTPPTNLAPRTCTAGLIGLKSRKMKPENYREIRAVISSSSHQRFLQGMSTNKHSTKKETRSMDKVDCLNETMSHHQIGLDLLLRRQCCLSSWQ